MDDEKREQVAAQCDAVVHLAEILAGIEKVNATMVRDGRFDSILDMIGTRTAYLMEVIGDVLSNIDAVTEEDEERLNPVFEAAQKMFPQIPA